MKLEKRESPPGRVSRFTEFRVTITDADWHRFNPSLELLALLREADADDAPVSLRVFALSEVIREMERAEEAREGRWHILRRVGGRCHNCGEPAKDGVCDDCGAA